MINGQRNPHPSRISHHLPPQKNTVDDGPKAARKRKQKLWQPERPVRNLKQIRELYRRKELGLTLEENRRHWHAANRFLKILNAARGEFEDDSIASNWREIVDWFVETHPDAGIVPMEQVLGGDDEPSLSDEMEFVDVSAGMPFSVVDCGNWNVYRDLPPPLLLIESRVLVERAREYLGTDFGILCKAIYHGWTLGMLGETEGFKDRAGASACGKGMLRSALRKLSLFLLEADRHNQNIQACRSAWKLFDTSAWMFADYLDDTDAYIEAYCESIGVGTTGFSRGKMKV